MTAPIDTSENPVAAGLCAACPVDQGTCPRCGTIWRQDGKGDKVGFRYTLLDLGGTTAAVAEERDLALEEASDLRAENERLRSMGAELLGLCNDDWLRRRDRYMELPGARRVRRPHAANAIEHAATALRYALERGGLVGDHEAYRQWVIGNRDAGDPDA